MSPRTLQKAPNLFGSLRFLLLI
uniref:Uncharacterized protein n=1 Tax=Anguilla anguilla TaxID=7936 RepID=A0A0E9PNQ9_ANGAN